MGSPPSTAVNSCGSCTHRGRRLLLLGIGVGDPDDLGGIAANSPALGPTTTDTDHNRKKKDMSSHVYRITEIVGTSPDGVDAAIQAGINRASTTLRGLDWFEVTEIRGHINNDNIAHYQVGMKIGFRMDA